MDNDEDELFLSSDDAIKACLRPVVDNYTEARGMTFLPFTFRWPDPFPISLLFIGGLMVVTGECFDKQRSMLIKQNK